MFDVVRRGEAVAVLLYDPDRDSVVLVEQFRLAALYGGRSPWQIETVAGLIDTENETPEEVARRETREESNLEPIGALIPIQRMLPASGSLDEVIWLYLRPRRFARRRRRLRPRRRARGHPRHRQDRWPRSRRCSMPARSRAATRWSRCTGCCATATACAGSGRADKDPAVSPHHRAGRPRSFRYPHATFLKCFDSASPWRW